MPRNGETEKQFKERSRWVVFRLVPKILGYSDYGIFADRVIGISDSAYAQKISPNRKLGTTFSPDQLSKIIEAFQKDGTTLTEEDFERNVYAFLDLFSNHRHFSAIEAWATRLFKENRDGGQIPDAKLPPRPAWPSRDAQDQTDDTIEVDAYEFETGIERPGDDPLTSRAGVVSDSQHDTRRSNRDPMQKYYGTFFSFYLCLWDSEDEHSKGAVAVDAFKIEAHPTDRSRTIAQVTQLTDIDTEDQTLGYLRVRDDTIEIDVPQSSPIDPNSFFMGYSPSQDKIHSMLLINLDITRGRRNAFARPTLFVRHDTARVPLRSTKLPAEHPIYVGVAGMIQTCMEYNSKKVEITLKDRHERISESEERLLRRLIEEFTKDATADRD
jgi:hypothetical protein